MGRAQLLSILLTTLMTSAQTAVRERVIRKADPISGELAEVMRGWAAVIGLDSPVTTSQLEELVGNGPHRTLDESDDEWKLRQQHTSQNFAMPSLRLPVSGVASARRRTPSRRPSGTR